MPRRNWTYEEDRLIWEARQRRLKHAEVVALLARHGYERTLKAVQLRWCQIASQGGPGSPPGDPDETTSGGDGTWAPEEELPPPDPSGGDRVNFSVEGNTATASSRSARIKTLEQLLEACQVDPKIWKVERWLANKWEVGAKAEYKDLTFTGGVIDGSILAQGLTVEPLFQVKAWLVRRHPEPIFPTVQPIRCDAEYQRPPPPKGGLQRALVLADPHFWFRRDARTAQLVPLHDRRALDVALQLAGAAEVDRIDLIGDLLDMSEWTGKFLREPEFYWCTQPSLLEGHWWLRQFREACPDAHLLLYEGNHERRMRDALMEHLPAAYGLKAVDELALPPALSLPKLLALHELGIEWVGGYPDEAGWLNDAVMLCHGDLARIPGNTAKAIVERSDVVVISAHIHRIEWTSRTKFVRDGQEVIYAFCPGCLCHVDGRVPAKRGRMQWQQGCAVVDYDSEGTMHAIAPVVIIEGRAIWNGRVFEARDRLEDLRRDVPDWNWA